MRPRSEARDRSAAREGALAPKQCSEGKQARSKRKAHSAHAAGLGEHRAFRGQRGPHYHLYPSSKRTYLDLREEIAPFTIEDGLRLQRWHAINVLRVGGEVQKPFIAKMAPPPSKRTRA